MKSVASQIFPTSCASFKRADLANSNIKSDIEESDWFV